MAVQKTFSNLRFHLSPALDTGSGKPLEHVDVVSLFMIAPIRGSAVSQNLLSKSFNLPTLSVSGSQHNHGIDCVYTTWQNERIHLFLFNY